MTIVLFLWKKLPFLRVLDPPRVPNGARNICGPHLPYLLRRASYSLIVFLHQIPHAADLHLRSFPILPPGDNQTPPPSTPVASPCLPPSIVSPADRRTQPAGPSRPWRGGEEDLNGAHVGEPRELAVPSMPASSTRRTRRPQHARLLDASSLSSPTRPPRRSQLKLLSNAVAPLDLLCHREYRQWRPADRRAATGGCEGVVAGLLQAAGWWCSQWRGATYDRRRCYQSWASLLQVAKDGAPRG